VAWSYAGRQPGRWLTVTLFGLAGLAWWWSVRAAGEMSGMAMVATSLPAFLFAWVAMMAAMMLPAVAPVVRLVARVAERGTIAPAPFFVSGYLLVWAAMGLPAYLAWRRLVGPASTGAAWAGRLAGGVLVATAVYQLTPLKAACLRRCRSPLDLVLLRGDRLRGRTAAARVGAEHGLWCFGCCWPLMLALVVLGAMQPLLMAAVAVAVYVETATWLEARASPAIAGVCLVGAAALLLHPAWIARLAG
jgi:predicted metal-binding membrane protein